MTKNATGNGSSRRKRQFKYKLSSFEQMFNELERMEAREEILIKYLTRVMKLAQCNDPDLPAALYEVLQVMFDEIARHPDKSPGFVMIENMGIDYYEKMKKELYND